MSLSFEEEPCEPLEEPTGTELRQEVEEAGSCSAPSWEHRNL